MPLPTDRLERRRRLARLSRMAVFLALGLALHVIENRLIPPIPIPGARLGLANLVTLVLIYTDGVRPALLISLGRAVLGSFFAGTFLGIAFWPTLAGALAAPLVMGVARKLAADRISPSGVSVSGAVAHNLAQLAAIYPFFPRAGLQIYLPFLILLAIPAGLATGIIGARVISAMAARNPDGGSGR